MTQPKTAVDRAMEMMTIVQGRLPIEALKYVAFLAHQFGLSGEVYVSAYATYAQVVEGLPCDDDLYAATENHRLDYEKAQRVYEKVDTEDGKYILKRIPDPQGA